MYLSNGRPPSWCFLKPVISERVRNSEKNTQIKFSYVKVHARKCDILNDLIINVMIMCGHAGIVGKERQMFVDLRNGIRTRTMRSPSRERFPTRRPCPRFVGWWLGTHLSCAIRQPKLHTTYDSLLGCPQASKDVTPRHISEYESMRWGRDTN